MWWNEVACGKSDVCTRRGASVWTQVFVYVHGNIVYICAHNMHIHFCMCIVSWQGRIYFAALFLKDFKGPLQRPVVSDMPVCNGIIWLDGIEPVIWEDSNQDGGSNTDIVKRVSHLGFLSRIPQKHRQHTQETQKKSRRTFTVFHR